MFSITVEIRAARKAPEEHEMNFKTAKNNQRWQTAEVKINGTDYTVNMMRFEEPSDFGIAGGRISKLFIFSREEEALWFDRDWVRTTPKNNAKEIQKLYEEIIKEYN